MYSADNEKLNKPFFSAEHITQNYDGFLAVNDVSFSIDEGEVVGLIGESGCGKTTLGRILTGLQKPSGGTIFMDGRDILSMSEREFSTIRHEIQMIFQDPSAALNPQFTVEALMRECLIARGIRDRKDQDARILSALEKIGLSADYLRRYPSSLSGGQKQRICIVLALLMEPRFLVADEIVSALDVSVQAQILNLIRDIQREMQLSILFISHDLSIVHYMSDRILVMFMGELVESGSCEDVYDRGVHPYTKALLSALDLEHDDASDKSDEPIIRNDHSCIYASRCPFADERCRNEKPVYRELQSGHFVKCHKA